MWEPRFTFHGFRYVQVDGCRPGRASTAMVCHSDIRRTGWFESLRRRSSTACTRTPYGGCAETSCPSPPTARSATSARAGPATSRCSPRPRRAVRHPGIRCDLADRPVAGASPPCRGHADRHPVRRACRSGPRRLGRRDDDRSLGLYERFGDAGILRRQYRSMTAWIEATLRVADPDGLWTHGYQIGDHLDPSGADRPGGPAPTRASSRRLICSGRSTSSRGRPGCSTAPKKPNVTAISRRRPPRVRQHVRYAGRADDVRYADRLFARAGFGLVRDADHRQRVGDRLAERVGRAATGSPRDSSARHWCWTRSSTPGTSTPPPASCCRRIRRPGCMRSPWRHDDLGTLGHPAARRIGAPERDDLVQPLRVRCGGRLAPPLPGRPGGGRTGLPVIRVDPVVLPGFEPAKVLHDTPYGRAEAAWRIEGEELTLRVVVPPGAAARVRIPGEYQRLRSGPAATPGPRPGPGPADVSGARLGVRPGRPDRRPGGVPGCAGRAGERGSARRGLFATVTRWSAGIPLNGALMFAPPARGHRTPARRTERGS